jgi:hypothetical protein
MTVLDAPRVDTIILDETILDETAKCEAAHKYEEHCSVTAEYRITSCLPAYNACASVVDTPHTGTRDRRESKRCIRCKSWARECWGIHPI